MATSKNVNENLVRSNRQDISCVFKAKCMLHCCMNNLREMVNMPDVFAFKGSHDESSDEDDKNQG